MKKVMGVINVTPDSFSDGGKNFSSSAILNLIHQYNQFAAVDIGAESTRPGSRALSSNEEWERWQLVLPALKYLKTTLSVDTYHPETIFKILAHRQDHKYDFPIIWNDVSGKFDEAVRDYLKTGQRYVFCHNLAPSREQTVEHRKYIQENLDLADYFKPYVHPQVIFDPCLGFSKSFEQNWEILENFNQLTASIKHSSWLLGFSRKSFLRQKFSTDSLEVLDKIHVEIVGSMKPSAEIELWIRTHRPEAI